MDVHRSVCWSRKVRRFGAEEQRSPTAGNQVLERAVGSEHDLLLANLVEWPRAAMNVKRAAADGSDESERRKAAMGDLGVATSTQGNCHRQRVARESPSVRLRQLQPLVERFRADPVNCAVAP